MFLALTRKEKLLLSLLQLLISLGQVVLLLEAKLASLLPIWMPTLVQMEDTSLLRQISCLRKYAYGVANYLKNKLRRIVSVRLTLPVFKMAL